MRDSTIHENEPATGVFWFRFRGAASAFKLRDSNGFGSLEFSAYVLICTWLSLNQMVVSQRLGLQRDLALDHYHCVGCGEAPFVEPVINISLQLGYQAQLVKSVGHFGWGPNFLPKIHEEPMASKSEMAWNLIRWRAHIEGGWWLCKYTRSNLHLETKFTPSRCVCKLAALLVKLKKN